MKTMSSSYMTINNHILFKSIIVLFMWKSCPDVLRRRSSIKTTLSLCSVEFDPSFIPLEETTWIFEELKCKIPWKEKNIKLQGNKSHVLILYTFTCNAVI